MRLFVLIFTLFLFSAGLYAFEDAECSLVRIIDGDTIVCNIAGWPDIVGRNISVRMRDCDSPEIRTSDSAEKALGKKAREELTEKLAGAEILLLKNIGHGKYFRLVADIYLNGEKLTCFENKYVYAEPSFRCGSKTKCSQMASCEEAYFYLNKCGVRSLDRDKDGIPCESICK